MSFFRSGAIDSCVRYIRKALSAEKRRHLGFTPHELMDGMSKLAVNDKNKKKVNKCRLNLGQEHRLYVWKKK